MIKDKSIKPLNSDANLNDEFTEIDVKLPNNFKILKPNYILM